MSEITLSGLYFYPVKSFAGISLERAPVEERGIRYDRHWMAVGPDGDFLTQRQFPKMALIHTGIGPGCLRLEAPGMPPLELQLPDPTAELVEVQVWGDRCLAGSMDDQAAEWLSSYLEVPCRLVFLPAESRRQVDLEYAREGEQVGFADGFPFLLISEASMQDLNGRLEQTLPMNRFRPNLVVAGCEPYAEDRWRRIRIGDISFRLVKPCSRCVIPTIDQTSAEKGSEPLATLSRYRRQGNKVYFGQNLLHDGVGELRAGMSVEVLESDSD